MVHEVRVHKGEKREVHLCEEHAREAGYDVPSPPPVANLVGQILAAASAPTAPTGAVRVTRAMPSCAVCKLSFHQFRQTGLLGCSECYRAFGEPLAVLIEKTQNAGVHHVGKVPRRCGGDIDLGMIRQRLSRELEEAVRAEQYERAAKLRDRILAVGVAGGVAGGASGAAAAAEDSAARVARGGVDTPSAPPSVPGRDGGERPAEGPR